MDRTDPCGPEVDHPPLDPSYLVVVPSYDLSCALILLTGLYGKDSMADIDIKRSFFLLFFIVHRVYIQ